jgi:hypothetical protein
MEQVGQSSRQQQQQQQQHLIVFAISNFPPESTCRFIRISPTQITSSSEWRLACSFSCTGSIRVLSQVLPLSPSFPPPDDERSAIEAAAAACRTMPSECDSHVRTEAGCCTLLLQLLRALAADASSWTPQPECIDGSKVSLVILSFCFLSIPGAVAHGLSRFVARQ